MSLHSYRAALELVSKDRPFSSYIMAAMLKADSGNVLILEAVFPKIVAELRERYDAPGGFLAGEGPLAVKVLASFLDTPADGNARQSNFFDAMGGHPAPSQFPEGGEDEEEDIVMPPEPGAFGGPY